MAGSEQGQQQGSGSSMDFLWGVIFVIVVTVIIWLTFKDSIIRGIINVKLFEINILEYFTQSPDLLALKDELLAFYPLPDQVTFVRIGLWMTIVGRGFNLLTGVILVTLALLLYFTHPLNKFCKTFDMHGMFENEKRYWPQINVVSDQKLVDQKISDGPWAMSLSPMQFAKKYNLLKEERKEEDVPLFPGDDVKVKVRKDAARHVFTHQIGPVWTGAQNLPIHTQAIFAILAARANRSRKPADKLIKQIAKSSHTDKLDFTGVRLLVNRLKDSPIVQQVAKQHAYVLTVIPTLLELARDDGVLATADFLWLKKVDRTLWYMLNNVGRRTAFAEISGPWSHWQTEKKMGRKLLTPMVEEAVIALDKAIEDIEYVPEPKTE